MYKNKYNQNNNKKVQNILQNHITHENRLNDDEEKNGHYEIPSQLEYQTFIHEDVHGGSGAQAATLKDMGFEPMVSEVTGEPVPRKKRVSKKGGGMSAGVGPMVLGAKADEHITGGALLSLKDLYTMKGDDDVPNMGVKKTVRAKKFDHPEQDPNSMTGGGMSGGATSRSKRNDIVRKVMQERGLSLPLASKYVK
jgi:hypothetical protein